MKRNDALFKIRDKLLKQEGLFKGYKKESINLRCLVDNLSIIILNEIENIGMLPPKSKYHQYCNKQLIEFYHLHKWEPENEEK